MDVASQNLMSVNISEEKKLSPKHTERKKLCNPAYLWIAGLVVLCVTICPFRLGKTVGESMFPTLKPNQIFLIYRCFGRNYTPNRNDVIVFRYQGDVLVKRVCATPGDSLWIVRTASGSNMVPPSDLANWRSAFKRFPVLGKLQKLQIKPGEIFVLGDNYSDSYDSRDFGPINADSVIGKVRVPENKINLAYNVAYAGSE